MAAFEEQLSGMAGEVRSSLTSEQFDLANYTEARARDLVLAAFSAPLSAPTTMVRFTFVVGGGKLVRAKYSDDLPKWMGAALRDIGYTADASAAETFDSQGTFKQQHDTGQNLKYLIVYPRVTCATQGSSNKGEEAGDDGAVVDTKSPEYIVSACEMATFKEIVTSKTQSWRQRKRLLKVLQDSSEYFQSIEAKLITGAAMTVKEQAAYESNSGVDAEKIAWLQGEIKKFVDEGRLTASEKEELLASIEENLTTVVDEIATAKAEEKPKKVEKLEEKHKTVSARKATVQKIQAIQHRLKHGEEILKLRLKVLPMMALEDKGRSMSLTLADLKSIEEKSDIETDIAHLENASRGWFEEESDFLLKCKIEEKEAKSRYAAKLKAQAGKKGGGSASAGILSGRTGTQKSSGSSGSSSSSVGAGGWSSIGVKKATPSGSSGAKKAASSGFAAAFGDSDSD